MSAQDKTEQVLREMHIMYANSEMYDKATNRVIIDKKKALNLLQRLNVCIYELMEEHELTQQSRDAAERQFVEMPVWCRECGKVLRILWSAKTVLSNDKQSGHDCSLCS